MEFKVIADTWAKQTTDSSTDLPDNQKARFKKGWQGQGEIIEYKDNHTRIKLDYWFYNEHINEHIPGNNKPLPVVSNDPSQLTKNFHLDELTRSETASRNGLDNTPGATERANLQLLCEQVLQPVRDHYRLPVVITSGYRSPEVNALVGGSRTSQHMLGQAADFTVPGIDNYSVAEWIRDNLRYDQLILEFYEGGNSGWIHVGYSTRHRGEVLTYNRYGRFNGLKRY